VDYSLINVTKNTCISSPDNGLPSLWVTFVANGESVWLEFFRQSWAGKKGLAARQIFG